MLTFDEESHSYAYDGAIVPSVTQVLQGINNYSFNSDVTARAAAFGTAVHKACELYDTDNLDMASLDEALRPYLNGWIKFRGDTGFVPTWIELRVYSKKYRYAGTLDRIGTMKKKNILLDIKTGVPTKTIGLQLAGYEIAAVECTQEKGLKRYACFLSDTGYKLQEYTDHNDHAVFLSFLNCYNWRKKNAS